MKTNLKKMALLIVSLFTISLITSSSITPGYDENGQDIDECSLYINICPEGYVCRNLPGSYICIGDGIELKGESSKPGVVAHVIYATCIGLDSFCKAKCDKCPRVYTSFTLGEAKNIFGICICGSTSFSAY